MREASTWMPLYIGDYLADTTHLTYAEHGAYLLLIMVYWRSGKPLPDDDVLLARYCRANRWQWKTLRPVLESFFQVRDGAWNHVRVTRELAHATAKSSAARANVLTRYKDKEDKLRTKVLSATDDLPSAYSSPSTENQVPVDITTTELVSASLGNGKHLNGSGFGARGIDWNAIVTRMGKHGFETAEAWSLLLPMSERPDLAKRLQGAMRSAEKLGRTARPQIETIARSVS